VPTGFEREPHFYNKELQLKMSCSYGPGRYDPIYEEKGIDYPPAYVRWTEKRNMEAFQDLIYTKKIDVGYLTTHIFNLEDAPKAYDMVLARTEPFIGILIEYDTEKEIDLKHSRIDIKLSSGKEIKPSSVSIGFVGAGSYAQSHLLPNIPKVGEVALKGVLTSSGTSSRSVAERFGFEFCTGNESDIFESDDINTVFVATRHDTHADYVLKALKAGKHVFVEKPLCLSETELGQIVDSLNSQIVKNDSKTENTNQRINQLTNQPILMVGFNRRFSPFAETVKEKFGEGPMALTYRVNAGAIPQDSWIQDPEFGGGRIIGEVCHFVDFLTFINGSLPVSVHANAFNDPNALNDTLTVSLKYQNGSIGSISYFANGDKSLPKERVEIYANGVTAVIDDFKSLIIHGGGKKKVKKLLSQDKGQKNEVSSFIKAILNGEQSPIPIEEVLSTTDVCFKIIESIRTGQAIQL
jgi:polar amino acid transport system substrate-binding protein